MFKKLKSLFIIEDEDNKKQSSTPQSGETKSDTTNKGAEVIKPKFDDANPPKGKVNEKFINRLLGAIEEGNLEGFDYLEFKQALQNLSNVDMDEATKYQSALAMAKTMGASTESLLSAAQHYVKILEQEEHKFLDAFKNQRNRQMNESSDKIKKLEQGIQTKTKRIEELKKEIDTDTQTLAKMNATVEKAKAKVEATKDSFYHAYHIVNKQIVDDIEKMKTYLK